MSNLVNITSEIQHFSILTRQDMRKTNLVPLQNFLNASSHRPVKAFSSPDSCFAGYFTTELIREIWSTAINMVYTVRYQGYKLSDNSFVMSNLKILDSTHLKFIKLEGTLLAADDDLKDFDAVADFINKTLEGVDNVPADVPELLRSLRNKYVHNNPTLSSFNALIVCNYALMTNTQRRYFLMQNWEKGLDESSQYNQILSNISDTLYPNYSWFRVFPAKSGLGKCYEKGQKKGAFIMNRSSDLFKFIRHALIHVPENNGWGADDVLYTLQLAFQPAIVNLQLRLLMDNLIDENGLWSLRGVSTGV